jgi:hypothetical protein
MLSLNVVTNEKKQRSRVVSNIRYWAYILFDAWVIDFTASKAKNTVFKHIIVGAANIFQH